jgi:hypothetical protein
MLPQSTTSYLYDTIIPVNILVDPLSKQRNRVVYAKTLKLYKGIDNEVKFTILNQEQQLAANIAAYSFTVSLVDDEKKSVILSKDCTMLSANLSAISVTFTESELQSLENQFFTYSLLGTDGTGKTVPMYIDDQFSARGQAQILSGHYPEFKNSKEVTFPNTGNTVVYSSSVSSQTVAHSAQVFFDDFTGTVTIQATSDPVPMIANLTANWFEVNSTNYLNQINPTVTNVEGIYSGLRFKIEKTTGEVTKILYRG